MSEAPKEPISIREFFRGKTLFLTGGTGFVGQGLIEKILFDIPEIRRIHLLIRPKGEDRSARTRFRREIGDSRVFGRLRRKLGAAFDDFLEEKVVPVAGDLGRDRLGMADEEYNRLVAEVDVVINSAAAVSFDERLDLALSLNTMGARRLTEFAVAAEALAFVHVSTCYVSGTRMGDIPEVLLPIEETPPLTPPGEGPFDLDEQIEEIERTCRRIKAAAESPGRMARFRREAEKKAWEGTGVGIEEEIEERRRVWLKERLVEAGIERARRYGWNDAYTYTKSLGEQMVARHRGKVPTSIYRPSIIESGYIEPEPGWIDGFRMADPLIAGYGRGTLYDFPGNPGCLLDVIPLDFVCNSILAVAAATPGRDDLRVYQSASGEENPITLGEAYRHVALYFDRHPMVDERGKAIKPKPWTFPSVEEFQRYYRSIYQRPLGLLSRFLGVLGNLGWAKRKRKEIDDVLARVERILYYSKIYSPYTQRSGRYLTRNTKSVWDRLSDDEKKSFVFDPTAIHWERYLCEIHIPGVKRHVLRMLPGGVLPASGPIRGLPKTADKPVESLETVPDLFLRSAYRRPDAVALQIKRGGVRRRYSYHDVHLLMRHVRHELRDAGIEKGDRVALWAENRPEWQIGFLGLSSLGAVGVPIDYQTPADRVWEFVERSRAKVLLTTPERSRILRREMTEESKKRGVEIRDLCAWGAPFGATPEPVNEEEAFDAQISPDDPALIIFTSGTTTASKGVPLTHRNIVSNVLAVAQVLSPYETDQFLSLLPLHHALEFTHGFVMPLFGGAAITHIESLNASTILEAMKETGTTVVIGVPRLVEIFWSRIEERVPQFLSFALRPDEELQGIRKMFAGLVRKRIGKKVRRQFGGAIRLFVTGGAALDGDIWRGFDRLGLVVCEGYGLTETAPVIAVNPLKDSRPGSVGPAVPGVEIRIDDPDERGIGEILVRGPNVFAGYLDDPERNEQSFRQGWFRTRDLGYLGDDGYLHLSGRRDDLIVTAAGKNVHPDEVETYYRGLPFVEEYSVLGVRDPATRGDQVHLVVRPRFEEERSRDEIRAEVSKAVEELSKGIPSHQRVQKVHFWDEELPKTATMKVKRSALKKRLEAPPEGEARPSAASDAESRDAVGKGVTAAVSRIARISSEAVQSGDRLQLDLALDSLMRVDLVADLENRFRVKIADEEAERWETVGDVEATVRRKRS